MGKPNEIAGKIRSILSQEGFKKYFKNTSWLFVEKIIVLGTFFVIGAFVARYLGPDQLGVLSLSQSLVGFVYIFCQLGINSVLTRELVKYPEKTNELLGSSVFLMSLGMIFSWGLLAVILFFFEKAANSTNLVIVLAGGYIFQIFDIVRLKFEAKVESYRLVKLKLLQAVIVGAFKIGLIWIGAPLIWFAVAYVLEHFILALWYILKYQQFMGKLKDWKIDLGIAKGLLRDSWPFILSSLAIVVYMKSDQLMIKYFLDDKANGFYATALKLSEMWYFFPALIVDALYPAILNAKKVDQDLYEERMGNLLTGMFLLGLSIAVFINLFGPWILEFMYGSEFNDSKPVLIIHIWSILFAYLGVAGSKWLLTEDLQKHTFYRTTLGAVINVGLNILWIPRYGIIGAAWATLIAQVFAAYLGHLLAKPTRPLFFMITRTIFFVHFFKTLKKFTK
ncbi:MAG: flippase [Bacteroidota bacterium]